MSRWIEGGASWKGDSIYPLWNNDPTRVDVELNRYACDLLEKYAGLDGVRFWHHKQDIWIMEVLFAPPARMPIWMEYTPQGRHHIPDAFTILKLEALL